MGGSCECEGCRDCAPAAVEGGAEPVECGLCGHDVLGWNADGSPWEEERVLWLTAFCQTGEHGDCGRSPRRQLCECLCHAGEDEKRPPAVGKFGWTSEEIKRVAQ